MPKANSSAPSKRGDHDVARGAQTAIGAQTHAPAKAVVNQHLLRFGKAEFPRIAGVLDARERRCAGAAGVAGDDDVIGIGLGDAGGNGANAAARNELYADGSARIDALQIPDELGEIFDRIDVVVRRRRDQAACRAARGAGARLVPSPCGPGAGRLRRAWRPGRS